MADEDNQEDAKFEYNQLDPNLPLIQPEIIIEFLLRLSDEDLFRCKFASKFLNKLMSSNPGFTKKKYEHHRLICKVESGLISCSLYDVLFRGSVDDAKNIEYPLGGTWPNCVSIVGSCNGLVCISAKAGDTLFIYNPSTETTEMLPRHEQDPSSFHFTYGFGYDETTHDYKVVRLWRSEATSPKRGTMIYSFKAKSWKHIRCPLEDRPRTHGKFSNGTLHWATGDFSYSWRINSFDFKKNTFSEVAKPEFNEEEDNYEVGGRKNTILGVLGEFLCVLCDYYESRVVDVWVMKVNSRENSWFKLARIPYPNDIYSADTLDPLCISSNGKVLLVFGSKLLAYDLDESSSTMIGNFDEGCQACIVVPRL